MSRTIRAYSEDKNIYSHIRKQIPKPGYAIGADKYNKKQRRLEKKEIIQQLEELDENNLE